MKFKYAFFAICAVLVFHILLHLTDGYYWLPQIDVPMHLLGGFAIGLLGLAIHHQTATKHHNKHLPWWYHFLFVIGFVMLIGVMWEFHEWVLDQTINFWYGLPLSQPSLANTMKDLLNDWIGGVVAFWMFRKKI